MSMLARHAPGLVALVVALSGTAYAVVALPSGSVGTRQLRSKAVTPGKLARSVVPSSPVLGARGPDGDSGPLGPAGERGATGASGTKGATGDAGPTDAYTGAWAPEPPTTYYGKSVAVPLGSYVVAGRARVTLVSGAHAAVGCNISALGGSSVGAATEVDPGEAATLRIYGVVAVPSGGDVLQLTCSTGGGNMLGVAGAAITALRVATLNG